LDYGKDGSESVGNFSQQYPSQKGGVDSCGLALLMENWPVLLKCFIT